MGSMGSLARAALDATNAPERSNSVKDCLIFMFAFLRNLQVVTRFGGFYVVIAQNTTAGRHQ